MVSGGALSPDAAGAGDEDPDYTALIQDFKKTGQIPLAWQWAARDLICAANLLQKNREHVQERRAEVNTGLRFHSSHKPILLLYGLALENLLKALLVAQGVAATATGELNRKLKTHNVLHLWREAGLGTDGGREALLRHLHWSIEAGKYPVGLKPDPKDPSPVWLALTSVKDIGELLATVEDALRARVGKAAFEKTDLLKMCTD